MTFGRFAALLLQGSTQLQEALARVFYLLTRESVAVTISGEIHDAQIHTQRSFWLLCWRGRHIEGYRQKEDATLIHQVGLPLDGLKAGLLIAANAERNQHTPSERHQRDLRQALKGHDALIIDNRAFRTKRRLDVLITLVGFAHFGDGADSQLRRKAKLSAQAGIDVLLKCKLVSALEGESDLCHHVAGGIEGVHRVQEGTMLLWRWGKLQKHRLFHADSRIAVERFVSGEQ